MADRFTSFDDLSQSEVCGVDFLISARRAGTSFAIVAPNGGGIEPGTSEIADAVAGDEFSYYGFEGIKASGNGDLHITSTRFDEPIGLILVRHADVIVTIHGEESGEAERANAVYLGGLDETMGPGLRAALEAKRFDVRQNRDRRLQGLERSNLCNRGRSGKGVQLELSRALRQEMFSSLSQEGRKHSTPRFQDFCAALRGALHGELHSGPCADDGDPRFSFLLPDVSLQVGNSADFDTIGFKTITTRKGPAHERYAYVALIGEASFVESLAIHA